MEFNGTSSSVERMERWVVLHIVIRGTQTELGHCRCPHFPAGTPYPYGMESSYRGQLGRCVEWRGLAFGHEPWLSRTHIKNGGEVDLCVCWLTSLWANSRVINLALCFKWCLTLNTTHAIPAMIELASAAKVHCLDWRIYSINIEIYRQKMPKK